MVRSRMPVPSLLCLFGVLLMLSPEGVMGTTGGIVQRVLTDAGVQKALAFVVEKHNENRVHAPNYFKHLRVLLAMSPEDNLDEYDLRLEMVETTCKKTAGRKMTYKKIQKCKQPPQQIPTCYFRIKPGSSPNKMNLASEACD